MTEEVGRRLIDGVWVTNVEAQGGGGGGGITRVTSDDETVTITNPTGPTVDLSAGGGSQPGAVRVLAFPFDFTMATALAVGVPVWTPAVDDWLIDAWIETTEAGWIADQVRPLADIGIVSGGAFVDNFGFFATNNGSVALDAPNWQVGTKLAFFGGSPLPTVSLSYAQMMAIAQTAGAGSVVETRYRFLTTDPLKLVVSGDGSPSGDPTDATSGTGTLYMVVSSPATTP